jgi:hypothetical protein
MIFILWGDVAITKQLVILIVICFVSFVGVVKAACDFTVPESILLGSEFGVVSWGTAAFSRTDVRGDAVRFAFSGLTGSSTGVKDNYPVSDYGQILPSHGSGDFSNFCGYSLWVKNNGTGSVSMSLFINTGFTGPSGNPPSNWHNDTFWQSPWVDIPPGQTVALRLDFDNAIPWNISDNPLPHTQGTDGQATAINAYDRTEVSSVGFQITGDGQGTILVGPASVVVMADIDSGMTSPTGDYRWLDVNDQSYAESYRTSYNYTQATVRVGYLADTTTLSGTLTASNLKPNFAYQFKLVGDAEMDPVANEHIGLTGRWWQEEWSGTEWVNGQNLNNKGDGSSPNPNDYVYFARRDIEDPSSPTGKKYRYTAYLPFDYFITDGDGNATLNFDVNSSYHVLWKTSQRTHTEQDGPIKSTTFDPDIASPAYDIDYGESTVSIFGEWERLPISEVFLQPGSYTANFILTEESFHGSGGTYAGNWAAAMGEESNFTISPIPGDFSYDRDVDSADLAMFVQNWLKTDCNELNKWCAGRDLDQSQRVDFGDFVIFAENWLEGVE